MTNNNCFSANHCLGLHVGADHFHIACGWMFNRALTLSQTLAPLKSTGSSREQAMDFCKRGGLIEDLLISASHVAKSGAS